MPDANNFTIGIMALIAQHEREAISTRTREALAVVRERIKVTGQEKHPNIKRLGEPERGRGAAARPGQAQAGLQARDRRQPVQRPGPRQRPGAHPRRASGRGDRQRQRPGEGPQRAPGPHPAGRPVDGAERDQRDREERVMSEDEKVSLEFVSRQLDRVLGEMRVIQRDMEMLIRIVTRLDHTVDAVREDIRTLWLGRGQQAAEERQDDDDDPDRDLD